MGDELRNWLEGLELGGYVAAFEAQEVSLGDLRYLTDADLKELGLPLGPRRRVLASIRSLPEDGEVPAQPPRTGI